MTNRMSTIEKKAYYKYVTETIDTCKDISLLPRDENGLIDFHMMWIDFNAERNIETKEEAMIRFFG